VIPRAHLTAWRKHAPWPNDVLVEQDLVLSRALVELYTHDVVADQLAFRGGTALYKLFIEPPARFSEDIDLVQVQAGPIGPVMDAIREMLDGWLGKPSTKQGAGRVTLLYRFDSDVAPPGRRRLKIEINTREHFTVLGLQRRTFSVSNPWFSGDARVSVYGFEELIGTKMRALYQRKKGRDLFDLGLALERPGIDAQRVVGCFLRYVEQGGDHVTRAQFERNLAAKAHDPVFVVDVELLLATGANWDFERALLSVSDRLVARIPGAPWKGAERKDG